MTNPLIIIRQAFSQIGRNINMAIASLFSITAILLILGIFFIILVNINNISESIKENVGQVQVNLKDTTDEATTQLMMKEFEPMEGVEGVRFMSKAEAMASFKKKWGANSGLLDKLEVNPLPNAIIVEIPDIEKAGKVVEKARTMPGTESVNYAQKTIDKLIRISNYIQIGALILIIALLAISIVVVSNTIKLTVLAREREITIMKYVGATNWFIRGPFLLEGIVIGLISAAVSGGVIALIYHQVVANFGVDFVLLMSTGFTSEDFLIRNLIVIYAALGASIGACGSIISMRRFLDT
ncbi:MAG: permease-like cell division protein FtsX [Clostridiales Family XIII bacterium]|jgi:cell division transport system permease protein|nr:permease-like cell division protein FtsX [Clostridiales Family XIII bacterium]